MWGYFKVSFVCYGHNRPGILRKVRRTVRLGFISDAKLIYVHIRLGELMIIRRE